jgi:hypothetical protein
VDPRNGAKYSPNLHRWLTMRNKKHHAWTSRVYRDEAGTLWIGMLDLGDLIGARLMNVLCYGRKAESCCWVNLRGLVEVADFWPRYVADGRCAIDTGTANTSWATTPDGRRTATRGRACGAGKRGRFWRAGLKAWSANSGGICSPTRW